MLGQPAANAVAAVQRVSTDPADLMINAISLIEMHRDNRRYEWRTIGTVQFGQPS